MLGIISFNSIIEYFSHFYQTTFIQISNVRTLIICSCLSFQFFNNHYVVVFSVFLCFLFYSIYQSTKTAKSSFLNISVCKYLTSNKMNNLCIIDLKLIQILFILLNFVNIYFCMFLVFLYIYFNHLVEQSSVAH